MYHNWLVRHCSARIARVFKSSSVFFLLASSSVLIARQGACEEPTVVYCRDYLGDKFVEQMFDVTSGDPRVALIERRLEELPQSFRERQEVAVMRWSDAVTAFPKNWIALGRRGQVYNQLGMIEQAEQDTAEATQLKSDPWVEWRLLQGGFPLFAIKLLPNE